MVPFTLLVIGSLLIYAVISGRGGRVWQALFNRVGAGNFSPVQPVVQT